MKICKYILSLIGVISVTLTALYFPGWYFDTYEYSAVIEDMEEQDYAKLGSTAPSTYMIYEMMAKDNYSIKPLYEQGNEESLDEDNHLYLDMVRDVFTEYMRDKEVEAELENGIWTGDQIEGSIDLLTGYMINWIGEIESWKVKTVSILNLNDMYEGKMVYVQLYYLELEIPESSTVMRICLDPDKKIFYNLVIIDERFALEDIVEDDLIYELVNYYQQSESKSAYRQQDEKLFDFINVVTAPGYVVLGIDL